MSGSVNRVIVLGNLGRDPEIRELGNGRKVCNLNVATSESWKDKHSGERKEKTEWHRVAIFDEKLVEVAERYLRKGSQVYLEGSLQTRKYDKDGEERYVTEIVLQSFRGTLTLLGGKGEGSDADRGESYSRGGGGAKKSSYADELDDEIPF